MSRVIVVCPSFAAIRPLRGGIGRTVPALLRSGAGRDG
jgi:hypothetical protein